MFQLNIHKMTLNSELLQQKFKVEVTTRVLRTINKYGGLDNYLLHFKDEKIDSEWGSSIKKQLIPLYLEKNGLTVSEITSII